ncbi:unnamed protein product [Trifolium pratense]|uniref:Uncharacterized protein n=1 Tax=Trifolium pratense TaxID=57577 RepID=A0ACB0K5P6_TRIPR|nr:unnamed protein product [Trifolium pratense]
MIKGHIYDPPMVCETDADCIDSWDPNFDIKCIEKKCEWVRKAADAKRGKHNLTISHPEEDQSSLSIDQLRVNYLENRSTSQSMPHPTYGLVFPSS